MKLLPDYIEVLKGFEGYSPKAYKPKGEKESLYYTIGYGHYGVTKSAVITKAKAHDLLVNDVENVVTILTALLRSKSLKLSPSRFTALVDFCFNVGFLNFKRSTLWRKIQKNQEDISIPNEFKRWVYSGKTYLPGLLKRREYCAQLWTN